MSKNWLRNTKEWLRNVMLTGGSKVEYYDPDDDMYEEYEEEPAVSRVTPKAETWQEAAYKATAPKSSFRDSKYNEKIVELYGHKTRAETTAQVALTSPKNVSNSNIVTDYIKDGKICAVNLTGVEREQAQRIVDVIAGGIYALNGTINRVSKDIFIVAPEGVQVSSELKEELSHEFPWASTR